MMIFVICQWLSMHGRIDDQDEECNCSLVSYTCWWSLYWRVALFVDHLSIIPREKQVEQCTKLLTIFMGSRRNWSLLGEEARRRRNLIVKKELWKIYFQDKKPRLWRKRCRPPPIRRARGYPTPPPCQGVFAKWDHVHPPPPSPKKYTMIALGEAMVAILNCSIILAMNQHQGNVGNVGCWRCFHRVV